MTIRRIETQDIPFVAKIIERNLIECMHPHHSPDVIDKFLSHNTLENLEQQMHWKEIYVVEDHNEITGTGAIANFGSIGVPKLCISNLFIHPDKHHAGYGRKLLSFLVDKCKSNNIEVMFVPSSRNAIEFYKKCGFIVEEIQEDIVDEITWMRKSLTISS